ncbi:hypothetical protein HY227_02800 [Candidatus Wolfebacteria bacterium]|nr:hypothetical protein [Candidatus Wolfebacteria bacterium]
MYNFILQIALMFSLGLMIYLVARAVPRIGDDIQVSPSVNKLDRLIASLPLEKIDSVFGSFLEKTLRRLRLVLMRLDNNVGNYLNKIKKFNNANGQKNGEEKATLFTNNSKEEESA